MTKLSIYRLAEKVYIKVKKQPRSAFPGTTTPFHISPYQSLTAVFPAPESSCRFPLFPVPNMGEYPETIRIWRKGIQ
jgi:hypothetical protein